MDTAGPPFSHTVPARNTSDHGAGLEGLDAGWKRRDTVGVAWGDKNAGGEIVWIAPGLPVGKTSARVRIFEGKSVLGSKRFRLKTPEESLRHSRKTPAAAGATDKRKCKPFRGPFPFEIRDGSGPSGPMTTKMLDVSGHPGYIATRMPFPVRKTIDVDVVFWLSSTPVHTPAVVRTCDGRSRWVWGSPDLTIAHSFGGNSRSQRLPPSPLASAGRCGCLRRTSQNPPSRETASTLG
jgi:hypothetical protein